MTAEAPGNDRLLTRLLGQIDRAAQGNMPSQDAHPDEESLFLFALGELRDPERAELVGHLSECVECRQTASALMTWPEITKSVAPQTFEKPGSGWRVRRPVGWISLAAAALVLLAVGSLIRFGDRGRTGLGATNESDVFAQAVALIEKGQFDEARSVVAEANRRGIASDRLRSLESQALRRIPATLALAYAGRLTDFGYEIGGAAARSAGTNPATGRAQQALEVLARSGSDDAAIALNRGHALLTLQRPRRALAEFRRVSGASSDAPLARIGEGLAQFALADYAAAERAFRACLRLDPNQSAARINLAMTLGEEGKIDEALAAWDEVLARPQVLTEEDRRAIRNEIEALRRARPGAPAPRAAGPAKKDQ